MAYRPAVLPLICLDVDGTLVGLAGSPSDELWAAAERARTRGQRLTLCTARLAAGSTRAWAERLDPLGWHVFHTGAARWNPATGEVREEPIPDEAVAACAEVAAQRGWVLETYSWDDYVVDSDDPLAVRHAALLALPHRRRPVTDLAGRIVRVQFVVAADDAAAAVAAAPPGTTASAATSPVMPGAAFVSVTVAGVSKAEGIGHVADDLGVPLSDVMMVGDGHNDLPAIEAVGWGVAMGNAEPEVIAAARLLVGDVEDHGAAQAIDASATLGGPDPDR
ncbi:MAG: Cof-like hydrolase [Ilumatobacteraceae bacterium]|nr:Cof-like hydrolase [Ilumatobacteraceae bacterium]